MNRHWMHVARPCLAFVAAPLLGQSVNLQEDFNGGVPAGWTNIHLAAAIDPWGRGFGLVNGSQDLYHEYFCNFGFIMRDNILLSPAIDLSTVTQASFFCEQNQQYPWARLQN